jgi:hypothetical protein
MPSLFICNVTNQLHNFAYWLPEQPRHFLQDVPIGGQVQVPGVSRQISREVLDSIVEQHAKYGLVSAEEALRGAHFSGLVYSIDKPVSFQRLQELISKYRNILVERGRRTREAAAVAIDEYAAGQLLEMGRPETLRQVEVEVEELSRTEQSDDSPEVFERLRVERGADDGTRPPRQATRRRRMA